MKPLRFLISILLLTANTLLFGQKPVDLSIEYYEKGTQLLKEKKYKEADSLLSQSAFLYPHRDTFYNLALARFHLGDKCGYCENMRYARILGDGEAGRLYETYCTKKDSINYDRPSARDSVFYSIVTTDICTHHIEQLFNIKNVKNGELTSFYFMGKDTAVVQEGNYLTAFPDIKNIPPDQLGYTGIPTMPTYVGGDIARVRFLTSEIKYPQEAKENGIQGIVWIKFFIEPDGSLTNVSVLKGIGGGCDEESVRVVQMMPKWNPGKVGNVPVKVAFNMPIMFTLN